MSYVQDEFQAFIEDPAAGCELKPALTTNYSKAATAITYLCPDIRDGRGEGLEIVRSRLLVFLVFFFLLCPASSVYDSKVAFCFSRRPFLPSFSKSLTQFVSVHEQVEPQKV